MSNKKKIKDNCYLYEKILADGIKSVIDVCFSIEFALGLIWLGLLVATLACNPHRAIYLIIAAFHYAAPLSLFMFLEKYSMCKAGEFARITTTSVMVWIWPAVIALITDLSSLTEMIIYSVEVFHEEDHDTPCDPVIIAITSSIFYGLLAIFSIIEISTLYAIYVKIMNWGEITEKKEYSKY